MKRLKTIASFYGNRNDGFFKVRRKNRKENGLIIGLFIKPARNRQRDKSRWIEWKTVQQGIHEELVRQDGIYRHFIVERREATKWRV